MNFEQARSNMVLNQLRANRIRDIDLIEKELTNHSISIYRDLHCWELSLNWTPTGYGQGVNFKLNVKSPTLQDIKVEKKGGIYSGAGLQKMNIQILEIEKLVEKKEFNTIGII